MKFKIPSKLTIGGNEITVKQVDKIVNSEVLGQCCIAESKIEIAHSANGVEQSKSSKLQTFMHELTHCILDTMGENELSSNEKFICTFSSFLNEAINSMEE